MKNLFNNMSQEEKNAIREQHTGGKKIAIENFSNMVNKKLGEVYSVFSSKGLKDINLLSFIYKPSEILSYLIYRETACLIFLNKFVNILTLSYLSSFK